MANVSKAYGLIPVGHLLGLNWSEKVTLYCIPSTDTNAYWSGDVVKLLAGGDALGNRQIVKILAGSESTDVPVGVIVGIAPTIQEAGAINFQGTPLALETPPIPATKTRDYYVWVVDDPYVIFQAKFDSTVTAAATCSKNCTYTVTAGPSSTLDYSGTVLTGAGTSAGLPLKLLGLSKDTAANTYGAYAAFRLIFNIHAFKDASAGV